MFASSFIGLEAQRFITEGVRKRPEHLKAILSRSCMGNTAPEGPSTRRPRSVPSEFARASQVAKKGQTHKIRNGVSNDPSAGSPTETLLRLLLPLSIMVDKFSAPTWVPSVNGSKTLTRMLYR